MLDDCEIDGVGRLIDSSLQHVIKLNCITSQIIRICCVIDNERSYCSRSEVELGRLKEAMICLKPIRLTGSKLDHTFRAIAERDYTVKSPFGKTNHYQLAAWTGQSLELALAKSIVFRVKDGWFVARNIANRIWQQQQLRTYVCLVLCILVQVVLQAD